MEAMLETGAFDANARDDDRATPAHYAAAKGHADIITRLAAAGANARACDVRGATPLHHAAGGGHAEAVDALASPPSGRIRTPPTPPRERPRTTPPRGRDGAVRALLRHGANPLFESADGTTPRDDAVAHGWTAAADALGKAASATGTGGARSRARVRADHLVSVQVSVLVSVQVSVLVSVLVSVRGGGSPPCPWCLVRRRAPSAPPCSLVAAGSSPRRLRPRRARRPVARRRRGRGRRRPIRTSTERGGRGGAGGEEVSASGASSGSAARGAGFRAGVPLSAPDAFAGRRATLPPLPSEETLSKPMPALVGSAQDAVAAPPRKREDSKAAFLSRYGLDKTPGLFRVDE